MSRFEQFTVRPVKIISKSSTGKYFIDYRNSDALNRLTSPNGKILPRKRTGLNAREQRMLAQAIKRARYMGLIPFTSATL